MYDVNNDKFNVMRNVSIGMLQEMLNCPGVIERRWKVFQVLPEPGTTTLMMIIYERIE